MLLHNARLVLKNRIVQAGGVAIENGRIAGIFDSPSRSTGADEETDLNGYTVFPGFIDMHIHGAAGIDTMDATADGLHHVAQFLAVHGVTAWLPTLVPSPPDRYSRAAAAVTEAMGQQSPKAISELSDVGARVLGVHYEGPFVNGEQCGALHEEHFRTFSSLSDLDTLPTIAHDRAIHMMTLAPEIDGGIALVRELNRRHWIISIGHTRADETVLEQAMSAGARHMTHFMNAMTGLHHRTLGAVGWGFVRQEVTCDVIADGVHIAPAILRLVVNNKRPDRISLISDAVAAAGLGDGEFEIWGETIVVQNGRTQNSSGHIAGSVITMSDAVRKMLALGFNEHEVASMAALNPAKVLGIENECGSIEEGKRADLVALDDERKVRLTMIGGQIAYQS